MHSVRTPQDFYMEALPDDGVFTIMPTTFEPGKKGPFFLSVSSDSDFILKKERGKSNRK